jgi:hypothetical protein
MVRRTGGPPVRLFGIVLIVSDFLQGVTDQS